MTTDEITDYYIAILKAQNPGLEPLEGFKDLSHILWMLYQMRTMVTRKDGVVDRDSAEKFKRWLCFIQGVLWWDDKIIQATIPAFRTEIRDLTYS